MKSAIEDKLTDKEKRILNLYRSPNSKTMRKTIRLSIQYALAAGIFSYLTVSLNPNFVWAVFGCFITWMIARIIGAQKIAGVIPNIIEKYEQEIELLKK